MIRKIILGVLSTLMCLTVSLCAVYAQGSKVDMSKYITLTVKQGAMIKLDFAASTSGVKVKIEGVKDAMEEDAPTSLHGKDKQPEYKATGTEINVYGAIDQFTCYDNGKNLIDLDVSQNVNLAELYCYNNPLSSLDVRQNVNLAKLHCYNNSLVDLDVRQNVNLVELYCYNNPLSSLDVRQNVNLAKLHCYNNSLASLDVSQNMNLTYLDCGSNQLSSLDVSQNMNLTYLDCGNNPLSSLDVRKNVNLTRLYCGYTQLSSLDVSRNMSLIYLDCSLNQLSSLDVSQNINLTQLNCEFNELSSLDVRQNVNLKSLHCGNNPLSSLDVSQNTELEKIWFWGSNFSTSTLNSIYCQLPDRTGKEKGFIYPVNSKGDVLDELLAKSSSKTITDPKNWGIQYWRSFGDIEDITGNYACGTDYALTLSPAAMSNYFSYQGGEWKTTVKSTGNWKIDESSLPDWIKVEPKEGNTGAQVTITVLANKENEIRRAAVTFVLANDANTKQVMLLTQERRPEQYITVGPFNCTFPAAGEKKENYFTVESSGKWALTCDADWLQIEPKEGDAGETKVTITAKPNSSKDARTAELTFAHKDNSEIKQVVTLKQKEASIAVTPAEEYTFHTAGEKKENYFTVESTGEWTVSSSADWLQVDPKEGEAGEKKVTITASPNSSKEARTAELTFAHKDNSAIKQVVMLKQNGETVPPAPKPNPNAVEDALFADVVVSPNPFHSQLRIKNGALQGEYILLNAQGVKIVLGMLEASETVVNTSELSAGIYLLQLNAAGGATKTYRVVKE